MRRKYLIILLITVGLFILGLILEGAFDLDLPLWFSFIIIGGFFYSTFKLYSIGAWGGGGEDGDD